ncbi:NACHT domain-containing protein [Actinoplanes sp. NPDC051861]|uniref:NACHT domain-containing protein n=1 Tax=Actinoplanes sp. NPDC051861 TaxID=3155170 RepID=UPI003432B571
MEPFSAGVLGAVARAIAGEAGKALARGLKTRVLDERAIGQALTRAFAEVSSSHGDAFGRYDLNAGFLEHEGASELAKVLIPGSRPSADTLARRCIDSLGGTLDEDERWEHMARLRPACKALIDAFDASIRVEESLAARVARVDSASIASDLRRQTGYMGAAQATADDERHYLHWVVQQHRHLRTVGMVRNHVVQLPLDEVYTGLRVRRETHPGDRARAWFDQEHQRLREALDAGDLDAAAFEAEIDRLQARARVRSDLPGPEAPAVPVMEAANAARHLLVLGDPGGGKTTLLRHLALTGARRRLDDPAALFPVYVRIGDFARSPRRADGLRAFLAGHLRSQECHTPGLDDLLARRLVEGRCLILLDGLDEVASAADRRSVVTAVVNFVNAHDSTGNRYVVTSRISGYPAAPLPELFQAHRLQDMDDETIEVFLRRYCAAAGFVSAFDTAAEAEAIAEALRSNPGIRRLAANPLLLTTLVLVHRARGRLPHRRVEAYAEVCDALGRTWRSVQGVPEAELPDERILTRWLTRLGAWIHRNRPEGSATRADLLAVLGPLWARQRAEPWDPAVLGRPEPLETDAGAGVLEFVEKVERHTGLLVERAPGRYGFAHLTFQEYYAGRDLAFGAATTAERVDRIREHLHDPRWQEPILLCLGLIARDQPEQLDWLVAEAIWPAESRPSPHEDLLGRDFLFVLLALGDDIPLDPTVVNRVVDGAADEYLFRNRQRVDHFYRALADRIRGLPGTAAGRRAIRSVADRAAWAARTAPEQLCALVSPVAALGPLPDEVVEALRDGVANRHLAVRSALYADIRDGWLIDAALDLLRPRSDRQAEQLWLLGPLLDTGCRLNDVTDAAFALLPGLTTSNQLDMIDLLVRRGVRDSRVVPLLERIALHPRHELQPIDNDRAQAVVLLHRLDALTDRTLAAALAIEAPREQGGYFDDASRFLAALHRGGIRSDLLRTATITVAISTERWGSPEAIKLLGEMGGLTEAVVSRILASGGVPGRDGMRLGKARTLIEAGAITEPVLATLLDLARGAADDEIRVEALAVLGSARLMNAESYEIATALLTDADRTALIRARTARVLLDVGVRTPQVLAVARTLAGPAMKGAARAEAMAGLLKAGLGDAALAGAAAEVLRRAGHTNTRIDLIHAVAPAAGSSPTIAESLLGFVADRTETTASSYVLTAILEAEPSPMLIEALWAMFERAEDGYTELKAVDALTGLAVRNPSASRVVADRMADLLRSGSLRDSSRSRVARALWDIGTR